MNEKTIAAIALSNRDFPSFDAKLAEAAKWIELAAAQGAELAVLPEAINFWHGDGPGNPNPMTVTEAALDDWRAATKPLFDVACRYRIAVTIPVYVRENGRLTNSFFLVSRNGKVLGRFDKMRPTIGELEQGCVPGQPTVISWEGLRVSGAICFDTNFPDVFEQQAALGADLFLVPSLSPGGKHLNYYALQHSTPIVVAYPAWSRIIDLDGSELAAIGYRWETLRFGFGAPIALAKINFDRVVLHADYNQEKMVEIQQKLGKRVQINYSQENCHFCLESRSKDLTAGEIVKRFGLMPLREYLGERYPKALKNALRKLER